MPTLPRFPATNNVFFEVTDLSHQHGGPGWEFGTCLWSPTTNASGHRVYELMKAPAANDLIIHILKGHGGVLGSRLNI